MPVTTLVGVFVPSFNDIPHAITGRFHSEEPKLPTRARGGLTIGFSYLVLMSSHCSAGKATSDLLVKKSLFVVRPGEVGG